MKYITNHAQSWYMRLHMSWYMPMGLLPDAQNCGLRMRRECRERFSRHQHLRKPLVSDPSMHHGTCVTHAPWCMSGSLTRGGGKNVPDIPGACATRNFTYLVRGPWYKIDWHEKFTLVRQISLINTHLQGPLFLMWFNFNPSVWISIWTSFMIFYFAAKQLNYIPPFHVAAILEQCLEFNAGLGKTN